ncbi:MAG: non-canonical purine pyrophosphatase, rdgB/HAM1 family [Rickettsiaceae bacterium]|jgi:XTP/dITP diphosphohydrolase|nr:non-canonical purine pyrophosphatase, rdgB/HAM1 family [Rickettsiaceae bacterium]
MNLSHETPILIASGNKGKLVEIAELLGKIGIKTISAADFNLEEPEETGDSFEENSIIKAKYYGNKTGFTALADDSGLCVDLLYGEPGIYSARWAIDNKTGEKNFALAFEKIKQKLVSKTIDLAKQKISAHFICNLTLYNPKTKEIKSFEGRVDGKLAFPARGDKGFGYDPIFIADGFEKTFGEILPQEKDAISHRTKAFEKLINYCQPL